MTDQSEQKWELAPVKERFELASRPSWLQELRTPEAKRLNNELVLHVQAEEAFGVKFGAGARVVEEIYTQDATAFARAVEGLTAVRDQMSTTELRNLVDLRNQRSVVEIDAALTGIRRSAITGVNDIVVTPFDLSPIARTKPTPNRSWLGRKLLGPE